MTQIRFDRYLMYFTMFNIGVAVTLWAIVVMGYAKPYTCYGYDAAKTPVQQVSPDWRTS